MTDSPSSDNAAAATGAAGPDTPPAGKRAVRLSKRVWIVAAVLGVLVGSLAAPIWFTATPGQCASCHEMKPYYDSWRASSHAGAASNCLFCHLRPGALSLVAYEFGFYREILAHLGGTTVVTTKANSPSVASCSRPECHSLNRETSNSGDIKINHRLHVTKANIACARCHPGAVHAGVGGRMKLPPLSLCKTCHADKMGQCDYCHAEHHSGAAPVGH